MQKVFNVRPKLQVEKLRDEGVQLKMLQTGLALMQCPLLADNEVRSLELRELLGSVAMSCMWKSEIGSGSSMV